jgi:hypothetical protein
LVLSSQRQTGNEELLAKQNANSSQGSLLLAGMEPHSGWPTGGNRVLQPTCQRQIQVVQSRRNLTERLQLETDIRTQMLTEIPDAAHPMLTFGAHFAALAGRRADELILVTDQHTEFPFSPRIDCADQMADVTCLWARAH